MTAKRYDVIDKEEPRGQSVTYNGIPCTARTCVTRLNRLTEENEQLKKENEDLQDEVYILQDDILNKRVRNLIKENEQLKKECKELRDWIDDITTKYKEQRGIDLENDLD